MPWTQLWFGKHKGKTLPQVIFSDPDWFFWAVEDGVFRNKKKLSREANHINIKSRKIKIPKNNRKRFVVEYAIHPPTNTFGHMEIVRSKRPRHPGVTDTLRTDCIDLSIPREIAPFDKLGCKNLMYNVKHYVFGSKNYRMTKSRCESFFEDNDNFEL